MNVMEASKLFEKLSFEVGRRVLVPEIIDDKFIKQMGAARLLVELFSRTGIDPIAVASYALEDMNYHVAAAKLRDIARMDGPG